MVRKSTSGARQKVIGNYSDFIKSFDVAECVKHPPLIEKLYEEKQLALVEVEELKVKLEDACGEVKQLTMSNSTYQLRVEESTRWGLRAFWLNLLATVLVGIGVNLATQQPTSVLGWGIIIAGCAALIVAFFSRPRGTNDK